MTDKPKKLTATLENKAFRLYITSKRSTKSIAEELGVSARTVEDKCTEQNWRDYRGKTAEMTREKTVEKVAEEISGFYKEMIIELMNDVRLKFRYAKAKRSNKGGIGFTHIQAIEKAVTLLARASGEPLPTAVKVEAEVNEGGSLAKALQSLDGKKESE